MDKRCKDCIYRGYRENDPKETWPFCMCKDEDLRNKAAEYWNYIHRYSIRYGVEHKIKEFPKEDVPSCQLVQAAYNELYGITCPNYKGVANVQEKE